MLSSFIMYLKDLRTELVLIILSLKTLRKETKAVIVEVGREWRSTLGDN